MALETWIMHACMVGDAGGIEPACTDAPGAGRSGAEARECAQMKKRYEDAHGFSSAGSPGGYRRDEVCTALHSSRLVDHISL